MSTLPYTLFGSPAPTPPPRLAPYPPVTPPAKPKRKKQKRKRSTIDEDDLPHAKKSKCKKPKKQLSPSVEPPEEEVSEVEPTHDPLDRVRAAAKARVMQYTATWGQNFCNQYHPVEGLYGMYGEPIVVVQRSLLVGALLNAGARYDVKVIDLICLVLGCEEDWEKIVKKALGHAGTEKVCVDDTKVAKLFGERLGMDEEMGELVLLAEVEAEVERRNSGSCVFYGLDGTREVLEAPGMSVLERVLKESMRYQDSLSLTLEHARI